MADFLYPRETFLYAATPAPREQEWLGWERFAFEFARKSEMALSISYNPEWEIWLRVPPSRGHQALAWARAAQQRGYYTVYPLADDPDSKTRARWHTVLLHALRFFDRRRHPDGKEAQRYCRKTKPYRNRDSEGKYIQRNERLPAFPAGLPDVGTDLAKILTPQQIAWGTGVHAAAAARGRDRHARKANSSPSPDRVQPRFKKGSRPLLGPML